MKNLKMYWMHHELRADGSYYDQLLLETKHSVCILFEKKSKVQ